MTVELVSTIIVVLAVALASLDVYLATDKRPANTISEIIWKASRNPIIPFAFGVIAGHLFW